LSLSSLTRRDCNTKQAHCHRFQDTTGYVPRSKSHYFSFIVNYFFRAVFPTAAQDPEQMLRQYIRFAR